jgi:trigger factor
MRFTPVKVTTEELERCEVALTIELEAKKEEDLLKKAAKRIAREVNIPGFRRGKAPFNTIVRRFGLEAIQQEALEGAADKAIKDALEEADIEPFAQIQLEDVSWSPLVFKLKVPTKPKVELSEYHDIRLEFDAIEVTDEDVTERLAELQEQHSVWSPVERPAQIGDMVSMTVTEKDGEEVLVDNEAVDYELTGPSEEDEALKEPNLTEPLLGLSAGDSKTFPINYPEDYHNTDVAGKEITSSVEITSVKEKELDPLDDDFAQTVSDFDTLDELKADIKADLFNQREKERDNNLGIELLEQLIDNAIVLEWPAALEEEEIDQELAQTERQLKNMGLSLESYLQMKKKSSADIREDMREGIVNRLKRGLVLSKVAEIENLSVSQKEILEQAKVIADYTRGGESMWQYLISSPEQQNMIANDLISNKAIKFLAAVARGETPELNQDTEEAEGEPATESDQPDPVEIAAKETSAEAEE